MDPTITIGFKIVSVCTADKSAAALCAISKVKYRLHPLEPSVTFSHISHNQEGLRRFMCDLQILLIVSDLYSSFGRTVHISPAFLSYNCFVSRRRHRVRGDDTLCLNN